MKRNKKRKIILLWKDDTDIKGGLLMNTIKGHIQKRQLVSFTGYCPMNCKHCYTYDLPLNKAKCDSDEIEELIAYLDDACDVIYISRSRENFIDEEAGIKLVEGIFHRFQKHILIITRKCLSDAIINRLAIINSKMKEKNLLLSVAISIPANESYYLTEDKSHINTPNDRCDCIRRLHIAGITTIFMARPIFPDRIIPIDEVIGLIKTNASYIDGVVASGLAVNPSILKRLNMEEESFNYLSGDNAEFLIGSEAKDIKYIDVSSEIKRIQDACLTLSLPFSSHSMEVLNMLIENVQ